MGALFWLTWEKLVSLSFLSSASGERGLSSAQMIVRAFRIGRVEGNRDLLHAHLGMACKPR